MGKRQSPDGIPDANNAGKSLHMFSENQQCEYLVRCKKVVVQGIIGIYLYRYAVPEQVSRRTNKGVYKCKALSRTDSNRTYQNDMSETSTTDGYITATDSMSGLTNTAHGPSHTTSSFDSVSSHFSLNKTDTLEELQQVEKSFLVLIVVHDALTGYQSNANIRDE